MKRTYTSALVLLLALAAAAPDSRAAGMDRAPSATLLFSDGSSKHLKHFTINGCLYRGLSTGIAFPPGKPVALSIATAKGELAIPVDTLKKIAFTLTTEKSSCGAPVYEVKVSRFKWPALAGWTTIGNIWEDKTAWGLDQYKEDQLRRLKMVKSLVFDLPPGMSAGEQEKPLVKKKAR